MTDSLNIESRPRLHLLSDVAEELALPPYRLRLWEDLYPVFHAERNADGQYCYSDDAVSVIKRIAVLLYQEGRKNHEIMMILKNENIVPDLKISSREAGEGIASSGQKEKQIFEAHLLSLTEENTRLREENLHLQEECTHLKQQNEGMQRRFSGSLSLLGQENARLLKQNAQFERSIQILEEEKRHLSQLVEKNLTISTKQEDAPSIAAIPEIIPARMVDNEVDNEVDRALMRERHAFSEKIKQLESDKISLETLLEKTENTLRVLRHEKSEQDGTLHDFSARDAQERVRRQAFWKEYLENQRQIQYLGQLLHDLLSQLNNGYAGEEG